MSQQRHIGRSARGTTVLHNPLRVIYHKTTVVEQTSKGIRLDSGGWRTPTTKTRMNQAANQYGLGFHVIQRDYQWFVQRHGRDTPFKDRMIIRLPIGHYDDPM